MASDRISAFGRRLRELRESQGLSRVALAEKSGVSWEAIRNWELGLRLSAKPSALRALATALEVSILDLIPEDEDEDEKAEYAPAGAHGRRKWN
jgi:transcriptional regulator with XRE-family HTH domain